MKKLLTLIKDFQSWRKAKKYSEFEDKLYNEATYIVNSHNEGKFLDQHERLIAAFWLMYGIEHSKEIIKKL